MPLPSDPLSPAHIIAMPEAQQLTLRALLKLDALLPPTRYCMLIVGASPITELTGLAYDEADRAAHALYAADWLTCFAATNADNADHAYTGFQPSDFARTHRAYLLRQLEHALESEAGR